MDLEFETEPTIENGAINDEMMYVATIKQIKDELNELRVQPLDVYRRRREAVLRMYLRKLSRDYDKEYNSNIFML